MATKRILLSYRLNFLFVYALGRVLPRCRAHRRHRGYPMSPQLVNFSTIIPFSAGDIGCVPGFRRCPEAVPVKYFNYTNVRVEGEGETEGETEEESERGRPF